MSPAETSRHSTLVVVPSERHVERLAQEGVLAETRARTRERLVSALMPDLLVIDARTSRMALGEALADEGGAAGRQLRLFAEARAAAGRTPLTPLREAGGGSWMRTVAALDRATIELARRGATHELLARVAAKGEGVVAARAEVLGAAMRAREERLDALGAVDERLLPRRLAKAIATADPRSIVACLGANVVRARWIYAWDADDLAWFRALDERLGGVAGAARVVIGAVDRPLEGTRARDAFEVIADDVARGLDGPPETEPVEPLLFADARPHAELAARVSVVLVGDASAQAAVVVREVAEALRSGAAVERIVVALPTLDEATLGPVRRALDEAGIVAFEGRGPPPSRAPVVGAALDALGAGRDLERGAVAALAWSGFVDAVRMAPPGTSAREAVRALARVADTLGARATAAGEDPVDRLVKTGAPGGGLEAEIARKLGTTLRASEAAKTRGERIASARVLWGELGLGAQAGRGGLAAFAEDDPLEGVARAERLAIARDARAWESLLFALDAYEAAAERTGALARPVDDELFRAEVEGLVDELAHRGAAARAGAVRLVRLLDLPGDASDLLVVVDAVDGVLPHDGATDPLVTKGLLRALAKSGRGAFVEDDEAVLRARQLAALAAGSAEAGRVVVVVPREDRAGAPVAPSALVDHLLRTGVPARMTRAGAARGPADTTARARAAREALREGFFLDPARPRSSDVGDLETGTNGAWQILRAATGGGEEPLAVTSLERFARCAFAGFVHVVLAGREPVREGELPDARDEGNLAHEALAAAFEATSPLWPARPRDGARILSEGLRAAEKVLDVARGHAKLRAITSLRVKDAVRAVLEVALEDLTWDFGVAEQAFGAPTRRGDARPPWPPLVVEGDGDRVALRGTIDRVDLAHDGKGVRVVDYKRSRTTVKSAGKDLGGSAVQVPLYAAVAARRHGGKAPSGSYVAFSPRDVRESTRSARDVEAKVAELATPEADGLSPIERRALAVVAEARAGRLAPVPSDESVCTYCAASGVCRKPRFAMAPDEEEDA